MKPPKIVPIITLGNLGIMKGLHFLDPLGGLGMHGVLLLRLKTWQDLSIRYRVLRAMPDVWLKYDGLRLDGPCSL